MDNVYRTITVPMPQLAATVRAATAAGWIAVAYTPVRGPDPERVAAIQIVLRRSPTNF